MEIPWDEIRKFINDLGLIRGTFVVFFWAAHAAIFALYNGRLRDRQKEIDRIAAENKDYRDRFTTLIDRQFKIRKNELPQLPSNASEKRRKRRR